MDMNLCREIEIGKKRIGRDVWEGKEMMEKENTHSN